MDNMPELDPNAFKKVKATNHKSEKRKHSKARNDDIQSVKLKSAKVQNARGVS